MKIRRIILNVLCCILMLSCSKQKDQLIYADASTVWWLAPTIIADEQKIYEKNDLDIKTFDVRTGLASKNAVLARTADVGMVAATPLAIGAYEKEDIVVLASFVESDKLIAILTKEKTIQEPVAMVENTISQFYFYKYMQKYYPDINLDKINKLYMKPPAITNTLTNGGANAVSIWEPFAANYLSSAEGIEVIRESGLYTLQLYLITSKKVLKEKRRKVEKFVKSIDDACLYISENEDSVYRYLVERFGSDIPIDVWRSVKFEVKYGKGEYDKMKDNIYEDIVLSYQSGIKNEMIDKKKLDYMFDDEFDFKDE